MARVTKQLLGVMVKQPRPGAVKSRLAVSTSPQFAAAVAEAFLQDLLVRLLTFRVPTALVFAPLAAESYFADLVRGKCDLCPQVEGDLGQRMAAFFFNQFQRGLEKVVLIGADSPTLPLVFLDQAFRELEHADVVLGPASDGGYYLVGCSRYLPELFTGISWSVPEVLSQTVERFAAGRLALLPPWYDVDTLDDWKMLQGHVQALRRAGYDPGIPNTERLLQTLAVSHGESPARNVNNPLSE